MEFIHFGCTSEDINNLAYGLMIKEGLHDVIIPQLTQINEQLSKFAVEYAKEPMLARTHGQAATPTTVGKEFANVASRLTRQFDQLQHTQILGKLNGATGNYNALAAAYPEVNWIDISEKFVTHLGLDWNAYTTQIEPHDYIAEIFMNIIRINNILMDLNRDMWGYISINYFSLKTNANEVGSSTMPHKVNPIDFENSEGNLGLANALLDHLALKLPISRWQRDLSDSTVLRNLGVAVGYAVLAYKNLAKGLNKVVPNFKMLNEDLNNHWEILAEPIQTIMRRYGIPKPYEKLKQFTRGQVITKELIHKFVNELDLPEKVKLEILKITPQNYLGYAAKLAEKSY
jgi:adenylosuccinate lyase